MKKLVNVSVLFGIIALVMLLAVGSAGAFEIEPEIEPGGKGEIEPGGEGEIEQEPEGSATLQEAEPTSTALRIDFEVAGHKARRGLYVVQYPGGDVLASWSALDGWEDSGWISNLDLPRKTVWVEVLYYPGPNAAPTVMRILNHAPGTAYGWVSQGMGHALEVAWPGLDLVGAEALPEGDGGSGGAGASLNGSDGEDSSPDGENSSPDGDDIDRKL